MSSYVRILRSSKRVLRRFAEVSIVLEKMWATDPSGVVATLLVLSTMRYFLGRIACLCLSTTVGRSSSSPEIAQVCANITSG